MSTVLKPKIDMPGRFTAQIAGAESFLAGLTIATGIRRHQIGRSMQDAFVIGYTTEKADWETRPVL